MLANGQVVRERIIRRDGRFAIGQVTATDLTATIYFNMVGPLQLSSFMQTPTRVRGSKLVDLISLPGAAVPALPPIDGVAPAGLARAWEITVHSYAVSEGIPADVRTSRETLAVSVAIAGATTVPVEVNDRPFRLPAFALRVTYADAATGDVVQVRQAHYIPALATTDTLEAFGNARQLTNLDAEPVERAAYRVAPDVLTAVIAAAR